MQPVRSIQLIGLLLLTVAAIARAQESSPPATAALPPSTAPVGDFEVHEWVILLCDPYQPRANADASFLTTLPDIANSRRKHAPATQSSAPHPIGLIRIVGGSEAKIDVRVQLAGAGRLMAAWPKPQSRSGSVLWRDVKPSREPTHLAAFEDPNNWLNLLRSDDDSAYLTVDSVSERFLLYDAEHEYPLPLKLAPVPSAHDAVLAANVGSAALHDLTFYRPTSTGTWQTGSLSDLEAGKKLAPTTLPSTAPFPASSTAPSSQPATATAAAATLPATLPTAATDRDSLGVDPSDIRRIQLTTTPTTQPSEFLAPWKDRLAREGVSKSDCDVIVRILELHALDPTRLTVVYRLDPAELDRILPLEVIPQPRKLTRVGLVIVRNIDPDVPAQIDELIARLGDRDWKAREAATRALAALGQAAREKLQAATKSADLEIATRAERLLASMNK